MNKVFLAIVVLCGACSIVCAFPANGQQPDNVGPTVDEVVVNTDLTVRKKVNQSRTKRGIIDDLSLDYTFLEDDQPKLLRAVRSIRTKRQKVGGSQSAANAAAQSLSHNKLGFSGAAAGAQAQGFQSVGPLGSFGSSAVGTITQAQSAGPGGISGSAGVSGGQTYNLPNGQTISVAYGGAGATTTVT